MRTDPNQSLLFGYIHPVTGTPSVHPPLCACGKCHSPVERFEPQPAAIIAESIPEPWEAEHAEV